MGKSLNTFAKPSLDEFCDYIDKHGFDLDPFALYKEFDKKGWTNAKGEVTKSWTALVNARNSIICQKIQNDRLVLLGIPKKRKHESKQKLQRRVAKAKTRIVKMHYDEFLQDSRWKAFRQFVFSVRGCKCERCESTKNLQVHHIKYKEGLLPWEYTCNDVMVLCRSCHEKIHGITTNEIK